MCCDLGHNKQTNNPTESKIGFFEKNNKMCKLVSRFSDGVKTGKYKILTIRTKAMESHQICGGLRGKERHG